MEYVLKVQAGIIKNEVVFSCLDALHKQACTFILRTSFIQELQYLPSTSETLQSFSEDDFTVYHAEKVRSMNDSEVKTESSVDGFEGSHVVKSLEVGNELIVIMTIIVEDQNKSAKFIDKIFKIMKCPDCVLDTHKVEALYRLAKKKGDKLMKKRLLSFMYCCTGDLTSYPASFAGMIKIFSSFMKENERWMETYKKEKQFKVVHCKMKCRPCDEEKEEKPLFQKAVDTAVEVYHNPAKIREVYQNMSFWQKKSEEDVIHELYIKDTDDNMKPDTRIFFFVKAYLFIKQHEGKEAECISLDSINVGLENKTEETVKLFENIYSSLKRNRESLNEVIFLANGRTFLEIHSQEAKVLMEKIKDDIRSVIDFVTKLDYISVPCDDTLSDVLKHDHSTNVHEFVERVTSKLPPGMDLDLLLLGKTGHGKSTTANSTLNKAIFKSSDDSTSVTTAVYQGYAEIDGRKIKVVDTPGVCDTGGININDQTDLAVDAQTVNTTSVCTIQPDAQPGETVQTPSVCDKSVTDRSYQINLAIKSISDAIAYCSEGFHALIIVLHYGIRMTNEEQMAIMLLKRLLGPDIIKNYCIFIFTHGDIFEHKNFIDWCRAQKGFLKNLFEECNYRCVLFDNKTTDPKKKKLQLINLITMIDRLQNGGQRYTNELFQLAQSERNKLIEEEKLPEVKEEIVRAIQTVYSKLQEINNKETVDQNESELNILKKSVDDLKSKTKGDANLKNLFEFAETLSSNIEKAFDELENRKSAKSNNTEIGSKIFTMSELEDKAKTDNSSNKPGSELVMYQRQMETQIDCINENSNDINEKTSKKIEEEIKKGGTSCFPGDSCVYLRNGKSVSLNELKIGDQVLTRDSDGYLTFDTVYMFGHQDFNEHTEFITIETISSKISLTTGHYIYCERNGKKLCLSAENIIIGDKVYVLVDGNFVSCSVIRIALERKQGLFAPFTTNGNIVINGILASCYINVLHPYACHNLLWPVRQLYKLSPKTLAYINGSSSIDPVPKWALFIVKSIDLVKNRLNLIF
ncbi:hypothetical protein Btru_054430 [Bulinus truncatus]|nr:hypothetical protein Btru_054430 [Bulinus truncatus]